MKKTVILVVVLAVVGLLVTIVRFWPDGKLHVSFCDVGQGDAAYIRFPNQIDMLIDGGPANGKVLQCLSEHMPFYDRNIDIVMLTHPQADHMAGLVPVLQRYAVGLAILPLVGNDTDGYKQLKQLIVDHHIPVRNLFAGSHIQLGKVDLQVLWPEKQWAFQHVHDGVCMMLGSICLAGLPNGQGLTLPQQGTVLGAATDMDLNDYSEVSKITYGSFSILFPGDADAPIQPVMLSTDPHLYDKLVTVLKVPHHGSKNGLTKDFLEKIKPSLAIISVGKNNTFGHPGKLLLDLLNEQGVKYLRTDEHGTVDLVSDGRGYEVN